MDVWDVWAAAAGGEGGGIKSEGPLTIGLANPVSLNLRNASSLLAAPCTTAPGFTPFEAK